MAKRFTDTDKWKDLWFEELSGVSKLFFFYYLDSCDCAGIWKGSFKQFCFLTGFKYSESEMLGEFGGKIVKLENGSYFMPSFIKFQYGTLSQDSYVHKGVFKSLDYNNIQSNPFHRVAIGYDKGIDTLKDKDKDKNKDKDKDKDKDKKSPSFDLDSIYALYPKKEGKKKGLDKLKREIKTNEKFKQLEAAVKNYSIKCKDTEIQFIKQFSSFASCWEDYVEIEVEHDEIPQCKTNWGEIDGLKEFIC